jgi:hypothetical protein
MRILFGSGDFIGSNIMVSRFVQHSTYHDVRIAAYYRNHKYLKNIDWCLDALYPTKVGRENYFQKYHGIQGPYVNHTLADTVINDLVEWMPELVISDCEPFTACIAKILDIPLWYCSSALQLIGIEYERNAIHANTFDTLKRSLLSLPIGDVYLVYSPLCDVYGRPVLKDGFEWVRPYSVDLSESDNFLSTESVDFCTFAKALPEKSILCTGETSLVSDSIYARKGLFVCPNPLEEEQILNAQLLEFYGCGLNIGRPQSLDFLKRQVERPNPLPVLNMQKCKQLDERIDHG